MQVAIFISEISFLDRNTKYGPLSYTCVQQRYCLRLQLLTINQKKFDSAIKDRLFILIEQIKATDYSRR